MPPTPSIVAGFQRAFDKTSKTFTPAELDTFKSSSLESVHLMLLEIQEAHAKGKTKMNLRRANAFLDAMDQYGKVTEVFLNSSQIMGFVWGPMKFLLQTASTWNEALDTLLDVYQQIAQTLPLFEQYRALFYDSPQVSSVLLVVYEDLLEFHQAALKVFTRTTWRQLFRATWNHAKTRFEHILDDLRRQKELLETQATIIQFRESRELRMQWEAQFERAQETERKNRYRSVLDWLRAEDVNSDQERYSRIWQESKTCQWILETPQIKAWCDPDNNSHPVLWIHGIPGSGKTILASRIIHECSRIFSISIAYFYCNYIDDQRNTFVAIGRTILAQLLRQNDDLLPYLYDHCIRSSQLALTSIELCTELLKTILESIPKTYIVLDGIDECTESERQRILSFYTSTIRDDRLGMIRILFVSRREYDIAKQLKTAQILGTTTKSSEADVEGFVMQWSKKIQERFNLSTPQQETVASSVLARTSGMILFAKLVLTNLYEQTSRSSLFEELRPDILQHGLAQVYKPIITKVLQNPAPGRRDAAGKILGFVICGKRPFKWSEIQGAISIDLKTKSVEFEDRQFRLHVEDLCGSLVEVSSVGRVELIHSTAKQYLIAENYIQLGPTDYRLTVLCLRYLAFEGFNPDTQEKSMVKNLIEGYYAFADYAVLHWVDHLESSIEFLSRASERSAYDDLQSAINGFYTTYGAGETKKPDVPNDLEEKCSRVFDPECTIQCLLIITNARISRKTDDQWGGLGKTGKALARIRSSLESLADSPTLELETKLRLVGYYGSKWFKCPKHSCLFFHEGFNTAEKRDEHVLAHLQVMESQQSTAEEDDACFDSDSVSAKSSRDESVFSVGGTSQISSRSSIRNEVNRLATEELATLLLDDESLKPLYVSAIESKKIGAERFERNFRRLLNQYSIDLKREAESNDQRTAASLVRSRSRFIATYIRSRIAPLGDIQQYELLKEQYRDEVDLLQSVEDYLEKSNHTDEPQNPEDKKIHSSPVPHGRDEISVQINLPDMIDSGSESGGNESGDETTDLPHYETLPRLSRVKEFMMNSTAFSKFCDNFRRFVQLDFKSRVQALIQTLSETEDDDNLSEGSISRLNILVTELAQIPPTHIEIVFEDNFRLSDRLKGIVEDITKEDWDWWPLEPRRRPIPPGRTRLGWHCSCGELRWEEVPFTFATQLAKILGQTIGSPNQQNPTDTPSSTHPYPQGGRSGQLGIPLSNLDLQGASQSQRPSPPLSSSYPPTRSVGSAEFTTTANTPYQGQPTTYILFGVSAGDDLRLAQIEVWNFEDIQFFDELRRRYNELRGITRRWLSIWRYSHCNFAKFEKIGENEIIPREDHSIPNPADRRYIYMPKPMEHMPPVSTHEFRRRFYSCHRRCSISRPILLNFFHKCRKPCRQSQEVLKRIPKKTWRVDVDNDTREIFWGINAVENISFVMVTIYHLVILFPPLIFWILWLFIWGHSGDLQNASVPFLSALGLLSLFWFPLVSK